MASSPQFDVAAFSNAARALWAKSGDKEARGTGDDPWLALPQHMLDSAGVADSLWTEWAPVSVRRAITGSAGVSDEDAHTLLTWLACVHDLGKATLSFQAQLDVKPEFARFLDRVRQAGLSPRMEMTERGMGRFPHALASGVIVQRWLASQRVPPPIGRSLAGVVDSHHGVPSQPGLRPRAHAVLEEYALKKPEWTAVHDELMTVAADVTGIRDVLPRLTTPIGASAQTLLTGLVIMADWIASNTEFFPLTSDGMAGDRRDAGLRAVDLTSPWTPSPPAPERLDEHLRDRFDWPGDYRARPVQRVVVDACAELTGPGLVIIEAPTGEGKTEAALTAAEILASSSGAGGVIVATPTMATADGLFRRVLDWSVRATGTEALSMFLGHSKSALNTDYRNVRLHGVGGDSPSEGTVIASQWMSGRKKGILSNVTVATVDQVLFMALQAKHSMLRHLGLAGKVVVIDEVHAYDAYMSAYLRTALAWLARYGVPVVLLSATLPVQQKRDLIEAYRSQISDDGLGPLSDAYPLVTTVSRDGLHEAPVDSRPADLHASVEIIDDGLEVLEEQLSSATGDGGCILVICNTVRRAQAVFERLRETFPGEVELHHAAFIASARARKEERLRVALGPDAHRGGDRPERRFIVATQVAEQSLDIDVDLLVTDIAPMDLLVQRIGRLHRHDRPESDRPVALRSPRVLLRGIETLEPPVFDAGARAVYGPKLLLSTLAVLQTDVLEAGFRRPDDIAGLVQSAYGEEPPVPSAWTDVWDVACAESDAARADAQSRSRTFRIPLPGAAPNLDALFSIQQGNVDTEDGEAKGLAQVRDSDPSVEVIPILVTANGYRPLDASPEAAELNPDQPPADMAARDLAAATVRLPARLTRYADIFDEVVEQLERATPLGWQQSTWLKGQLALPLDAARSIELAGRTLQYDDDLGLRDTTPMSP